MGLVAQIDQRLARSKQQADAARQSYLDQLFAAVENDTLPEGVEDLERFRADIERVAPVFDYLSPRPGSSWATWREVEAFLDRFHRLELRRTELEKLKRRERVSEWRGMKCWVPVGLFDDEKAELEALEAELSELKAQRDAIDWSGKPDGWGAAERLAKSLQARVDYSRRWHALKKEIAHVDSLIKKQKERAAGQPSPWVPQPDQRRPEPRGREVLERDIARLKHKLPGFQKHGFPEELRRIETDLARFQNELGMIQHAEREIENLWSRRAALVDQQREVARPTLEARQDPRHLAPLLLGD